MNQPFALILFLIIPFSEALCQSQQIDSLIYEISVNLSYSNPSEAHRLADSLFIHSETSKNKLIALMLTAEVYKIEDRQEDVVKTIVKALNIAKETNDFNAQSKIYGYLSTSSRQIGFFSEGKFYLQKGIEAIAKTGNQEEIESYKASANREFAEFEMEVDNYEEALLYLENSVEYYKKYSDQGANLFMLSRVEEIKGRCYLALNDYQNALSAFQNAVDYLQKTDSKNSLALALTYQGLGESYRSIKEMDSSYFYLNKAQILAEESTHDAIKAEIYESMSKYFLEVGIPDSVSIYSSKFHETNKKDNQKKKVWVNDLTLNLPIKTNVESSQNSKYWWILGGGLIFLFGGIFLLKKSSNRLIFINKKEEESHSINLSEEIEKKLEEKIKAFEKSKLFLNPNMSFSLFVDFLETNSKYLNHFLKTRLEKDYNTYINDLRINYIVQQINKNKEYRKYKISYLAKESGFSSHSNFSVNFRRVMYCSPSEYIEKIDIKKDN